MEALTRRIFMKLATIRLNKKIAIAFFCASLSAISVINLGPSLTSLVIEHKTEQPDTYQVFYDVGDGFNQKDSTIFLSHGERGKFVKAVFDLPGKIDNLRIDFGERKADIAIKSIRLKAGFFTVYYWGSADIERDFNICNNVSYYYEDVLHVKTTGNDPWIVYSKEFSKVYNPFKVFLIFIALIITCLIYNYDIIKQAVVRKNMKFQKATSAIFVLFALATTPLLLFISTSNQLFLNNQDVLGHRVEVLLPFVKLFLATVFVGLFLYFCKKYRKMRYLLWAYFIVGPAFLFYNLLGNTVGYVDSPLGLSLFLIVSIAVVIILYRKVSPSKAINYFAVFGLLLAIFESYSFFTKVEASHVRNFDGKETLANSKKTLRDKSLPNIYHIVVDEYQTDMFEMALTPEIKNEMRGFIYFPEHVTNYGKTVMSLCTMSRGIYYDYKSPLVDFVRNSFNSENTIIYELEKLGYDSHGIMFAENIYQPNLFDHMSHLENNADVNSALNTKNFFWDFWLYSISPKFVSDKIMKGVEVDHLKSCNFLPGAWVISSRDFFMTFIKTEKYRSSCNRYIFMHLIVPHVPYILCSDCSYNLADDGRIEKTNWLEQAECTIKMIVEFVRVLKELGRFENSLIIIQSDHGARFIVENGSLRDVEKLGHYDLKFSWGRSRALLLLKPIGNNSEDKFVISDFESMLLDIAPTIFSSLGIEPNSRLDGVSLLQQHPEMKKRVRYYHFYDDVEGQEQLTKEMRRFVLRDNGIFPDKTLVVKQR